MKVHMRMSVYTHWDINHSYTPNASSKQKQKQKDTVLLNRPINKCKKIFIY